MKFFKGGSCGKRALNAICRHLTIVIWASHVTGDAMIQVIQACWRRRMRFLTARPALLTSLAAFGAVALLPTSGLTLRGHLALSKEVVSGRFGQRLPLIIARVRPESLSSHAELSLGLP